MFSVIEGGFTACLTAPADNFNRLQLTEVAPPPQYAAFVCMLLANRASYHTGNEPRRVSMHVCVHV